MENKLTEKAIIAIRSLLFTQADERTQEDAKKVIQELQDSLQSSPVKIVDDYTIYSMGYIPHRNISNHKLSEYMSIALDNNDYNFILSRVLRELVFTPISTVKNTLNNLKQDLIAISREPELTALPLLTNDYSGDLKYCAVMQDNLKLLGNKNDIGTYTNLINNLKEYLKCVN